MYVTREREEQGTDYIDIYQSTPWWYVLHAKSEDKKEEHVFNWPAAIDMLVGSISWCHTTNPLSSILHLNQAGA